MTRPSSEQLRHIAQAAGLAPSVHNTQPWGFVARPDGLELHADLTRTLHALDPDGRQLHLSCGAALQHARVAARALGLDVQVRLLPEPAVPTHLADLVLAAGPRPGIEELGLGSAILHRHTFRGSFSGRPVPAAVLTELRAAAEREGAGLHEVRRADQLVELAVLLSRASDAQERDAGYQRELAAWVHPDLLAVDGLPLPAVGAAPGSSLRQREFGPVPRAPGALDPPDADRPVVLILVTDTDTPLAWLRAGQALGALLLHAADRGVQAQPLGQVTDGLAARRELRSRLGLVGHPQLVLRMGYADAVAVTRRRDVEDVLAPVGR